MLGVTTETASRMIAELKRSQIIIERKVNTFVCDDRALREIAGE
jgi:hypothetical protein